MANSIEFYKNSKVFGQKNLLNVTIALNKTMERLIELKKSILPRANNVIVYINDNNNSRLFRIVYRDKVSVPMILIRLPLNDIVQLKKKNPELNDPILILDYIIHIAREEYKKLGSCYNKRSEKGFTLSKLPRHNFF